MSYKGFYRYIVFEKGSYHIVKDNERYGSYRRLEDALYERDRLIAVDWDWDLSMELPETPNNYIHIDLPPFDHMPTNITVDKEHWVVRGKGKEQRYYGRYYDYDEAKRVAMIYNANISHKKEAFRVQKRIKGKTHYFGRYPTMEKAQARVKELEANNWRK